MPETLRYIPCPLADPQRARPIPRVAAVASGTVPCAPDAAERGSAAVGGAFETKSFEE
jgi:hypothetical protein